MDGGDGGMGKGIRDFWVWGGEEKERRKSEDFAGFVS
jgi:hypothetical protein